MTGASLAAEAGEPRHREREEHREQGQRPGEGRPHVAGLAARTAEEVAGGGHSPLDKFDYQEARK